MNCEKCKLIFQDKYNLEIHRLKMHENIKSTCIVCGTRVRGISHHINNVHPERKDDTRLCIVDKECYCTFCGMRPVSLQSLVNHIKNAHIVPRTECSLCKKFIKNTYMIEHKKNFHSTDIFKWNCSVCKESFKHQHTYDNHLKTKSHLDIIKTKEFFRRKQTDNIISTHLSRKPIREVKQQIKCVDCSKICKTQAGLTSHRKKMHDIEGHVKCIQCEATFSRVDGLERHIRERHGEIETEKCEHCHFTYSKRELNGRHRKECELRIYLNQFPGTSKWERLVSKWLITNNIEFQPQYKCEDLKNNGNYLRYDFYCKDSDTIIEVHGKQHYEKTNYRDADAIFTRTKLHDDIKEKYALKHFSRFHVIDTRFYNDEEKIFRYLEYQWKDVYQLPTCNP